MLQLFLSLLTISGIAALLALLLELADSYIADYGESHILINEEKDVLVEGGNPLLATLMANRIFIPSACGGKGTCALCKLKIHEGGGPVLPTETPYLSQQELEDQVRLSCQVKVKNDLKIEIPEELFLIKEFEVVVERMETLTPDNRGLRLKILRPEEGIKFKPGQYVQLQIPKYELTKGPEFRAYSIASSCQERDAVELVITKVPEGAVSTYVHDYLKEGDQLTIIGPYGDFYLRESDRDILLIATGSGLAPVKSILSQLEVEKTPKKITLFFGDKKRPDLLYYDELKETAARMSNFTYTPTLSRANEEEPWEGERGRVTNLIEKYVPQEAPIDVYICGVPAMVESCEELLKKKGIPEERIFYDKFTS
jgi:Na+-transporting NADH:ubiquinone oxidoreductase subunit F